MLLIPTTVSVLNLEHSEKNHVLDFKRFFLSLKEFVLPPLIDLLESSKMLEMPNRFPSVMLLSLKKDPVDSVSRSEEESVDELRDAVSKVLNEIEPLKSEFLANPTLAFTGCNPRGHPSS